MIFIYSFFRLKGSLTRSFSTVSYYKDIDTLAELDQSGLRIGTSSGSLQSIFTGANNSHGAIRSLSKKFHIYQNATKSTILRTAYDRDICCIERWNDIGVIIPVKYEFKTIMEMRNFINKCFILDTI